MSIVSLIRRLQVHQKRVFHTLIREYCYQTLPARLSGVPKRFSTKIWGFFSYFFHFSIENHEKCDRVLNRVQCARLTGYSALKLSTSQHCRQTIYIIYSNLFGIYYRFLMPRWEAKRRV
jgi:hypothetical protein